MSRSAPLVPNRWSREVGAGFCYAALYCTLRAVPDGTDQPSPVAVFYVLIAALLLYSGVRLNRRDRW